MQLENTGGLTRAVSYCSPLLAGSCDQHSSTHLEVTISNLIPRFLKIGIISSLELLVQLFIIPTIFDAKAEYLLCRLCICNLKRRCAVELDILSSFEHVPFHVENLPAKATRLGNTIIDAGVTCFGAVTNSNRELARF